MLRVKLQGNVARITGPLAACTNGYLIKFAFCTVPLRVAFLVWFSSCRWKCRGASCGCPKTSIYEQFQTGFSLRGRLNRVVCCRLYLDSHHMLDSAAKNSHF